MTTHHLTASGATHGSTIAEPEAAEQTRSRPAAPWSVILHDDQLHTYEYVIEMLCALFAMDPRTAYHHALEVDTRGITVVARLPRPEAEKKRDAIMRHGGDHRMRTTISMVASVEPDESRGS